MQLPRLHYVALTSALLASASPGAADLVVTSDGSRLVGKIEQWADGKVVIATQIAGTLAIDTDKVTAVAVEEPMAVQFASGDRLVGTIELSPDDGTATMHTALGDVVIEVSKIDMAWAPQQDSPQVVALKKRAERIERAYRPHWSVKLEGGGVFKEGNVDEFNAQGRMDLQRKTPDDSLLFYAAAEYSEQNDIRNKNEYRVGSRYQHDLDENWSWYVRSMLEFDEFEDLDLRALAAGGIGYHWLKTDVKTLQTSLGAGFRHETFDDGRTTDDGVIDVGFAYRHDLAPWVHFTHATTYSPAWDDAGDYRLDADTALVFPLKAEAWKLKLGVRNEYNSRPLPGIKRLDNTFYANVALELK